MRNDRHLWLKGMSLVIQECYSGAYFVKRGDWTFDLSEARQFCDMWAAVAVWRTLRAESVVVELNGFKRDISGRRSGPRLPNRLSVGRV
jgi:hypothetical protein